MLRELIRECRPPTIFGEQVASTEVLGTDLEASFVEAVRVPGRVGLLRGYGNAIVPQIAAEFIAAFMETQTKS